MIQEAEDNARDDAEEIRVSFRTSKAPVHEYIDKFAFSSDDLKKFYNVSATVRRRVARQSGSKRVEEEQYNGYNFFGAVTPPENLDYLARLYSLSSPHFAAVRTKVANVVGLGYDLVESPAARDKVNAKSTEEATESARKKLSRMKSQVYEWIDTLNEEDDFTETLNKFYTDFETTGNGYLEIGRDNNGQIGYIGHIPCLSIRVRQARDGFIQIIGKEVVFFRNFGDKTTPNPITDDENPNEILHLKKYSPVSSYYGSPDIKAATQAIAGNEFSSRYNLDYFENKAVPRYVIVIKGGKLGLAAQADIISFFESAKGENHRTLFVPLPADTQDSKVSFEMKPVETGIQEASFSNYRKGNNSDVFLVNQVPPSRAGQAENIGLAAAQDASRNFLEQVVKPAQRILEKKLNRIIAEKTDAFVIKFTESSLVDQLTQAKIDETYLRWGVIVPNDIRVGRWGKEALPDGDKRAKMPAVDGAAEIAAQKNADQNATARQSRTRDQQRSSNATDSINVGRNAQGNGRTTE